MRRFLNLFMLVFASFSSTSYSQTLSEQEELHLKTKQSHFAKGEFYRNRDEDIKLFKKATELGNPVALGLLGLAYKLGDGVKENQNEAFKYFTLGFEKNDPLSTVNLGIMYAKGIVVTKNFDKARELYLKIYNEGKHTLAFMAAHNLAIMYHQGEGVPIDINKAYEYYKYGADNGYIHSYTRIGFFFENGLSVKKDNAEAEKWYLKAANEGIIEAKWRIGDFYFNGRSGQKELVLAYMWYKIAATEKDDYAIFMIKELEKTMSKAKIIEAKKLASEWLSKR